MSGAAAARLGDGRLHLQHGPIDVILEAWGEPGAVAAGEARAVARFGGLLEELVAELPALRAEAGTAVLRGPVARRMGAAAAGRGVFVTPMAAVAGAVADELMAALWGDGAGLRRAVVNDGGDVAVRLAPGERLRAALAVEGAGGFRDLGRAEIAAGDGVGGIATSGWRGRSWSLGIADAVTVLAGSAAEADVAATLIANAVDLPGHPAIRRGPARAEEPDSDLGERLVTLGVGALGAAERAAALAAGVAAAEGMRAEGRIVAAALTLGEETRVVGALRLGAREGAG